MPSRPVRQLGKSRVSLLWSWWSIANVFFDLLTCFCLFWPFHLRSRDRRVFSSIHLSSWTGANSKVSFLLLIVSESMISLETRSDCSSLSWHTFIPLLSFWTTTFSYATDHFRFSLPYATDHFRFSLPYAYAIAPTTLQRPRFSCFFYSEFATRRDPFSNGTSFFPVLDPMCAPSSLPSLLSFLLLPLAPIRASITSLSNAFVLHDTNNNNNTNERGLQKKVPHSTENSTQHFVGAAELSG